MAHSEGDDSKHSSVYLHMMRYAHLERVSNNKVAMDQSHWHELKLGDSCMMHGATKVLRARPEQTR